MSRPYLFSYWYHWTTLSTFYPCIWRSAPFGVKVHWLCPFNVTVKLASICQKLKKHATSKSNGPSVHGLWSARCSNSRIDWTNKAPLCEIHHLHIEYAIHTALYIISVGNSGIDWTTRAPLCEIHQQATMKGTQPTLIHSNFNSPLVDPILIPLIPQRQISRALFITIGN